VHPLQTHEPASLKNKKIKIENERVKLKGIWEI
jgi:hypothetical protein